MIRLFHVSDLHFGAEDKAALDWFRAVALDERPDALIVTGDLTMRARSREFEAAAAWLDDFPMPVSVEVGNHDLPYFNPFARFARPYKRYRRLERLIERPLQLPGITVVPLKTTARAQWRLNWSKGNVSDRAIERALDMIAAAPAGNIVLVACHHPLVDADTRSTASTRGGPAALRALAKAGADAVLSGHVHDPFDRLIQEGGRPIRLIGAGTLSERVRDTAPSFNEIVVDGGAIQVAVRTMTA
jgi:3',5'-cyclic AMP phosphodiesterase CpdA